MVMPSRKGHRSLTNGIDAKILGYVREFSQSPVGSTNQARPPGVTQLYTLIQDRDVQLRRIKKAHLEASIQRAIDRLRSEVVIDSDGESFDSNFEGIEDLNLVEIEDTNTSNKLITSQWTSNQSSSKSVNQTSKEGLKSEPSRLVSNDGTEIPSKRKASKSRNRDQKRQKSIHVSMFSYA